jgi:uncharacterized oligopeptide transporter (OPT) family protein
MEQSSRKIEQGGQVTFQYRRPACLGGEMVSGAGVVVGETIVGVSDAYIIKPSDGSDCVHVRASGVWSA